MYFSLSLQAMSGINVLALSSSRAGGGGYLEAAAPLIKDFLGTAAKKVAFIPFAAVDRKYEDYTAMVREGLKGLPHTVETVMPQKAKEVIEGADVIMIGGGNTFKLLHDLYDLNLVDLIQSKVQSGVPYIGWSAGANITGCTISTTNDMPIIQPQSFRALAFFPFQINPHYLNQNVAGHHGETRDQRLTEFLQLNPAIPIVALPEGTALQLKNGVLTNLGSAPAVLFTIKEGAAMPEKKEIEPGTNLASLL